MRIKMNNHGFSLTELIVVIAMMTILLTIASLNFNSWQRKFAIENQLKEIMADLSGLRMTAIQTKNNHAAVFSGNQAMVFRSYTSEEPVTLTTGREILRKQLKYSLVRLNSGGTLVTCGDVGINSRGFTNFSGGTFQSNQTILVQPTGSGAALDCMVISDTRINLGKYDGTKCSFR